MIVAVFGSSKPQEGSPAYQNAYELGKVIGAAGHSVMTGGYHGVMEAAARGCVDGGGETIGVTCADIDSWRPGGPNPYIRDHRPTANLMARLDVLMREADVFVAMPGGIGTLGEIILALNLMGVRSVPTKPLIAVGEGWQKTFAAFYDSAGMDIAEADKNLLQFAPDLPAVLEILNQISAWR